MSCVLAAPWPKALFRVVDKSELAGKSGITSQQKRDSVVGCELFAIPISASRLILFSVLVFAKWQTDRYAWLRRPFKYSFGQLEVSSCWPAKFGQGGRQRL